MLSEPALLLFRAASEDERQAALRVADDDDLRVRAQREFLGRLDALQLEDHRREALLHDLLKVRDALGLDALSLGLLLLLLEDELHLLGLLLALQLLLDRVRDELRQSDLPEQ